MYLAAAKSGFDIFLEKPVTDIIDKIDEMIAIRDKRKIIVVRFSYFKSYSSKIY